MLYFYVFSWLVEKYEKCNFNANAILIQNFYYVQMYAFVDNFKAVKDVYSLHAVNLLELLLFFQVQPSYKSIAIKWINNEMLIQMKYTKYLTAFNIILFT